MLRWLLHKAFERMAKTYDYDMSYMHEVTDISPAAAMRYLGLPMMSQVRGPNVDLWAGASLGSVLDGDCGSCAQLIVDMALEAGAEPDLLRACLTGDMDGACAVGMGYRFALAAISDTAELEGLRSEIAARYGDVALVAVAYASASARAYPVLKRGLGHGGLCQRLEIDGDAVAVHSSLRAG